MAPFIVGLICLTALMVTAIICMTVVMVEERRLKVSSPLPAAPTEEPTPHA